MTSDTRDIDRAIWRRAPGVHSLGLVSGSGLTKPTYLVQRRDEQVVQLSELLNLVLEKAGNGRAAPELATAVSATFGKELTVDGLHHLIDTKLGPLGLIEDVTGRAPAAENPVTARPLLSLSLRGTILPASVVRRIAGWLSPLYLAPVVVVAVIALIVLDAVLLATGDFQNAVRDILITPTLLLALFALLTLGGLIHELGHATACRFGGAEPGVVGFGLYLVFPAFFTNVTDSYCLGRTGRVRTDLGGLYFNVWCVLLAGAGYLLTREGIFFLFVIATQFQMLQQLPPTIRLDGYFVLADLAGIPDLFSRVGPVLRSLLPGREPDPRVTELRPAARRIVTVWVLTVIPLLVLAFGWLLWNLPAIVGQTVEAIASHAAATGAAVAAGRAAEAALGALSVILLVLPLAGLALVLGRSLVAAVRAATNRIGPARSGPSEPPERTPIVNENAPRPTPDEPPASSANRTADAPEAPTDVRPVATLMPRPSPAPWLMAPARKTEEWVRVEPPSTLRPARASFLTEMDVEPPAVDGWRGLVARTTGLQVPPAASELEQRRRVQAVSRHWSGPRGIAVVNGKGGVGKTVTNAMLAAVFARNGGSGVLAWDNNDTRGTLGWRTEKSDHDATVHDLLPQKERLLLPSARVSDLAPFVHHQTSDKYDVLRSNPELLATGQRITQADFDALQLVVTKYYRMIFFDSGNDESAPRWLRMIDHTDQLVVATTALGEAAESGALLLEALHDRDEHSARLAKNAVVVVLQSERNGGMAAAQRIADGFASIARAAVTIPFDRALHGGALRFDSLSRATQDAWLAAGAAVADGL
ncbi:AAA family ATPase [Lacisediminihabitans sp.]|uniref:AAA family ATPase n=1 Tax=Lacisediminihabitans sp. TaxID=2787631 RepID=UPI00374D0C70